VDLVLIQNVYKLLVFRLDTTEAHLLECVLLVM